LEWVGSGEARLVIAASFRVHRIRVHPWQRGPEHGAQGIITMIDTPTARGVSTRYDGNLTLSHGRQANSTRSLAAASSACGPR
jgi:hypothetical protein